jgi:hypothetical protein
LVFKQPKTVKERRSTKIFFISLVLFKMAPTPTQIKRIFRILMEFSGWRVEYKNTLGFTILIESQTYKINYQISMTLVTFSAITCPHEDKLI